MDGNGGAGWGSLKTINNTSILGSGNIDITVYDYATKAEIDAIFE